MWWTVGKNCISSKTIAAIVPLNNSAGIPIVLNWYTAELKSPDYGRQLRNSSHTLTKDGRTWSMIIDIYIICSLKNCGENQSINADSYESGNSGVFTWVCGAHVGNEACFVNLEVPARNPLFYTSDPDRLGLLLSRDQTAFSLCRICTTQNTRLCLQQEINHFFRNENIWCSIG